MGFLSVMEGTNLPAGTASAIQSALQTYGETLLGYFVEILAPLAAIAAILFVISIVKRKVGA